MTTATTTPTLFRGENPDFESLRIPVFYSTTDQRTSAITSQSVSGTQLDDPQLVTPRNRRYVVRVPTVPTACTVKMLQYGEEKDALILVDFGVAEVKVPNTNWETVWFLRANGRPILADKLVAMLQEAEEDPDEVTISMASLKDMARFLVEHGGFADPSIGPDGYGVMHAQWRLPGHGLLAMSFLGYGLVLLTARVNESPGQERLRISKRVRAQDILRECGHLVPLRN